MEQQTFMEVQPAYDLGTVQDLINQLLGDGGALADLITNYKARPGQLALAHKIAECMFNRKNLLSEAPTGTGKSMAYGIPAAAEAQMLNNTVLIVTANITLQEQLYRKDLPMIAEMMSWVEELPPLNFSLVKGMSNYICLDKIDELGDNDCDEEWYNEILEFLDHTETGDKSELEKEYPSHIWREVSSSSDECSRGDCPLFEECYVFKAKNKIKSQASVIVTNYHLLYTDFLIKEATAGMVGLLPRYSTIIFDEAHEACDIAMSFNGFQYGEKRFLWLTRRLGNMKHEQAQKIARTVRSAAEKFFGKLHSEFTYDILRKPLNFDSGLVKSLEVAVEYLKELNAVDEEQGRENDDREVRKVKTLITAYQSTLSELSAICWGVKDEDGRVKLMDGRVYYMERDQEKRVNLCCKSVDVQNFMAQHIYSKNKTVIAVSATLSTNNNFDFIAEEMGLKHGQYEDLIVESPFDPERLLLVVPDIPSPKQQREAHMEAVPRVIETVAKGLNGRTMALFTSYKALQFARDYLQTRLGDIRILVQGQMPKQRIIQMFKEFDKAVILATASFWQGVDIPGEDLSCLVIDKFPFAPPSDPVLKYLEKEFEGSDGNVFFDYSIPKAVITLKQGVGRLIRTEEDFGAVVFCDSRIDTTGYGKQFLKAFPRGHFKSESGDLGDVIGFIQDMSNGRP